jgi:hypothetical protein
MRGSTKALFAKRYTVHWQSRWTDLGGSTRTSDPTAVFDGSRLWLFVRRSGDLWYRVRTGSWSGWHSLGHPPAGGAERRRRRGA